MLENYIYLFDYKGFTGEAFYDTTSGNFILKHAGSIHSKNLFDLRTKFRNSVNEILNFV